MIEGRFTVSDQPEPPPPKHAAYAGPGEDFFVVGCLNCRFCGDAGHPHKPERWVCAMTKSIRLVDGDDDMVLMPCHETRNDPKLCALKAQWFKDAITGR